MFDEERAVELAGEHWDFIGEWLEMIYLDAFVHGYKHGKESKQEKVDYVVGIGRKAQTSEYI